MSSERDPEELRHEFADRVIVELSTDLPRVSPHFGEQYADVGVREARAMRQHDNTFE